MSETVRIKGKLTKLPRLKNESLEEQCKRILLNCELETYYDTYKEMLLDEHNEKYTILDDNLYHIQSKREDIEYEFFEGIKNKDDSIDFHVMYYNGGCDLNEALEEVYNKL